MSIRMSINEAIEVIKAYKDKLTNSVSNQLEKDIEAYDIAINAMKKYRWHPISEQPKKDGRYLVTIKYITHKIIEVRSFAKDLYQIDEDDFCDKKGQSGWYGYDSEWGYYEQRDITGWSELPEFYEESICESCVHNYKDRISSNGICLKCDNESEYKEKSNE